MTDAADKAPRKIQSPRGTRDLYPAEAARRRWLTERWREVSVRHGFEEVDGPTYEEADLYAVKSGEGILGELFQAFSGKSPEEVEQVKRDGRAPYALRPEFTPTLARMYAAKAAGLPKPCKWFMAGPFFRAERPQRGRLREFLQWNVDIIGHNSESAEPWSLDEDIINCCTSFLEDCGLQEYLTVHISNRYVLSKILFLSGATIDNLDACTALVDRWSKLSASEFGTQCANLGLDHSKLGAFITAAQSHAEWSQAQDLDAIDRFYADSDAGHVIQDIMDFCDRLNSRSGIRHVVDFSLARGLAYYTGTVFEVIADGERAVAGGGRYDNLIELFGGPPTPAVGFAMGDVVLSLLLQDKGLMPSDDELIGLVGQRPEVFVLSEDNDEAFARIRPVVAMLRRGTHGSESRATAPQDSGLKTQDSLHARHSYKATRKTDKLLNEAKKQGAKLAVIIENAERCTVRDLRTGEQWSDPVAIADLHAKLLAAL